MTLYAFELENAMKMKAAEYPNLLCNFNEFFNMLVTEGITEDTQEDRQTCNSLFRNIISGVGLNNDHNVVINT